MNRRELINAHPDVYWLDAQDPHSLGRYLVDRGWLVAGELPITVERAGEGNMNCTLRVRARTRSLVVKQGRPWVEKYDHIPAPWDRTLVEGRFYETIAGHAGVAPFMPAFIGLDAESRILALEDVEGSDFTWLYAGAPLADTDLDTLVAYLGELHRVPLDAAHKHRFANREMRVLNHEHLFQFPLRHDNGLDLDRIAPGLRSAARSLQSDPEYVSRITSLGEIYLQDGDVLLHGDFFPGSWLRGPRGICIIDPEFCFPGPPELDLGIMLGHLLLARQPRETVQGVLARYRAARELDVRLVRQFAGMEIMRRLIGVAQLPLSCAPAERLRLLDVSRSLVLHVGAREWT